MGAVLPYDNKHFIKGIYVRGLDWDLREKQLLMEFASFGKITAVSFPREGNRLSGYAMIQYESVDQAAAAIFGL
ncbi:MAG: RNA recognition motif domain-containing protein, partial [Candidatus Fonsibacter sp.]